MKTEQRSTEESDTTAGAAPSAGPGVGLRSLKRAFSSFENYNYRLFWSGQLLSRMGSWISRVAQAWLVLQLTGSSFQLGW